MSSKKKVAKKYWFYFKQLNVKITNYWGTHKVKKRKGFTHNFLKNRPYLITDEGEYFSILFCTTQIRRQEKEQFGPVKCPKKCPYLPYETRINLNTKVLISKKFAKNISTNLGENEIMDHSCLSPEELFKLQEELDDYWKDDKKNDLLLIELGMEEEIVTIET